MQRRFILGLGAQKAGTTWLSQYIRNDPSFVTGPVTDKELHIWDRRDLELFSPFRRKWHKAHTVNDRILFAMEKAPVLYFAYFRYLLRNGGITADISPSYSGLSAGRLSAIAKGFAATGIELRTVFIMRDPLTRCISAFNMIRARKTPHFDPNIRASDDDDTAFGHHIRSMHCRMRTDYVSTLAAISQALNPDQTAICLHETFFQSDSLQALSEYLGVGYFPDRAAVRANPAKRAETLSERSLRDCANFYRPTYEAVAEKFPQVLTLWKGYEYLA